MCVWTVLIATSQRPARPGGSWLVHGHEVTRAKGTLQQQATAAIAAGSDVKASSMSLLTTGESP